MRKRVAIITPGGIGAGHLSQGYPPLLNFIQRLSSEFDITVYSLTPINPDFIPSNFRIKSISKIFKASKVRGILLSMLLLYDHFRNSYQLIHSFWVYPAGTLGVILGKLIHKPSVVTIQGGEAAAIPQIGYGNMFNPSLKKITLWTCERASCLNSISKFLVNEMSKHGLKRKDSVVIPFGPETSLFMNVKKVECDRLRIIHVANLTEVKDQVTLLKAFALILKEEPAELRIIGGDFMEGKLQVLANEMRLDEFVKFLGAIPNTELTKHYAWADIMMHTSLHEGQSGVVMEAMASGVVVCGTRVGILYDLEDEYFETVEVGDYQTLASKIIDLWRGQDKYRELQTKSLSWAQKYNLEWTVKKFGALYKSISHSQ